MNIGTHVMGPSRLNHGESQCVNCLATNREIQLALGPNCPRAPEVDEPTHKELKLEESEVDLVKQALASYAKRPHLPIVQRRITTLQRRIDMAQLGLEA
jgi:hypothetical protein